MLNNQIIKFIESTGEILSLANPVVEKDYYVTQAIQTISSVESDYFQLVFTGGTCLSKAHKVIQRMSEDIDFKIQTKPIDKTISKSQFLKELKEFRSKINTHLIQSGLVIGETAVLNEGRYLSINLNYPSGFPANVGLRPHILLEFTLSNVHLPIETLPIKTLIEDTLKNIVIFEPSLVKCVSVNETAIEKWVGLTRRVSAIDRKCHDDDVTLIRHVYDLNAIKSAGRIDDNFFQLGKEIVSQDAKKFENQHPEYARNPSLEISRSLELLKMQPSWKKRYEKFSEAMVYGNVAIPEYEAALSEIEQLSLNVISLLNENKRFSSVEAYSERKEGEILPIEKMSQQVMHEALKEYVAMELRQTAVMQENQHRDMPGYEQRRKEASAKAVAMGKEMTNYALEVVQSPDLQTVIEDNKVVRAEGIAERGGYIAINQRIQEGVYLPEDIKAVVNRINANAEAHKQKQRALSHDQGRGGRSR